MEQFTVQCSQCQQRIHFDHRHANRRIKCPGCSKPLDLKVLKVAAPEVFDPFSDLADSDATTASDDHSIEGQFENPESESIGTDNAAASKERNEPEESFIDEFGLAELIEVNTVSTDSPSLPPVAKQFVRKKAKRSGLSTTVRSLDSSSAPGFTVTKRKVTTFRTPTDASRGRRFRLYALLVFSLLPLVIRIMSSDPTSKSQVAGAAVEPEVGAGEGVVGVDDNRAQNQADGTDEEFIDRWRNRPAVGLQDFHQFDEPAEDIAVEHERSAQVAFLTRGSSMHLIFAALSFASFMLLVANFSKPFARSFRDAVLAAVLSATAGIAMLMFFQWAATSSAGFRTYGRGIAGLHHILVAGIGFSYRCAMDQGNGVVASLLGFTLGAGTLGELCKITPVFVYLAISRNTSWQQACVIGLASGVGFGVSEGIMYSAGYDNGVEMGDVYLSDSFPV